MSYKIGFLNHKNSGRIIFAMSIAVSLFWMISQQMNVYQYALTGALYELLAIPMLLLFVFLQTVVFINMVKERFSFKTYSIYTFLLLSGTFVLVVYQG